MKTLRKSTTRNARPALEQLDERVLPSLTPVSPDAAAPYTAVVKLEATFPNGATVVGTGAMVDSYHVLTAGHLLYSAQDGGYATSITAIPDDQQGSAPFGVAYGTNERVDPSWITFNRANAATTSASVVDLGLVTLNQGVGYDTGWFNLASTSRNSFFHNTTFRTAGYPASYTGGEDLYGGTLQTKGTVSSNGVRFSQNNVALLPGESGSPLWRTSARGRALLYGVVTGATGLSSSDQGYATRITPAASREINKWIRADQPPSPSDAYLTPDEIVLWHPSAPTSPSTAAKPSAHPLYKLDAYEGDSSGYDTSGYDIVGGEYVDPSSTYVPSGYDVVGGQYVDPSSTYLPSGYDSWGGQAVDPYYSYIPTGYDVWGGQAVDPSSTYYYPVYYW